MKGRQKELTAQRSGEKAEARLQPAGPVELPHHLPADPDAGASESLSPISWSAQHCSECNATLSTHLTAVDPSCVLRLASPTNDTG